jgi:quinol monooxygenase YgiN
MKKTTAAPARINQGRVSSSNKMEDLLRFERLIADLSTRFVNIPLKSQALESIIPAAERTRIEPGCLSARISPDEQQEEVFLVEEVWQSQENLDRHLRSDHYRQVLLVTEMSDEPPDVQFRTISQSAGLEIVEKARSGHSR